MLLIKIFLALLVIVGAVFAIIKNAAAGIAGDETDDMDSYERRRRNEAKEDMNRLQKLKPIIIGVLCLIFAVCCVFGSVYFTSEQEIGFTSMFGQNTMIDGPGMHFKVPFLSQKHIYDATTQGMPIGYYEDTDETLPEDSLMITSDFNFVNIDFYVEYRITDPIEYCYGSNDPEGVLKNVAQASIRNTVGQYDVDSVMTTGKVEIEAKVREDIIKELEGHNLGISIGNVTIQDSEAPTQKVAQAFTDVSDARTKAEEDINAAHAYENSKIPAAEAQAEEIKQAATAAKTERVNSAKEEVARFEALFTEYQNNPETVRMRLYYEAMQEILPNMEIIIGEDAKVIYVKEGAGSNVGTSAAVSQATSTPKNTTSETPAE